MEIAIAVLLVAAGFVAGLVTAVFLPATVGDWRHARRAHQEDQAALLAAAIRKEVAAILTASQNSYGPHEGSKLLR